MDNIDIKIRLSSLLYDWVQKTAKDSDKSTDQLIEDAIRFYKFDIENPQVNEPIRLR